ncbi:hypothetical protein FBQ97_11460, partial [Acidobacteria bacterium ACD]|nr:hypothetical protein [Acidobacteria bacterium ACD]
MPRHALPSFAASLCSRLLLRLPLVAPAVLLGAALLPAPRAVAQNVSSVALSPAAVVGGSGSTGTVTLSGNAPAGGSVVTLASSKAQAVVPASVTVPAGTKVATFPVTTTAVTASTSASITATRGTSSKSATLTILPLLSSLTVSSASVVGGAAAPTGKITLNGPA